MKSKLLLIVGLVLVIAAAIAILSTTKEAQDAQLTTTETEVSEEQEQITEPVVGVGTLAELSARNERLECTVQYRPTETAEEVSGSFFVADGNVRGDFVQTDPSLGEIVTSYIVAGDTLYLWSLIDGQSYGIKADASAEENTATLPVPDDESVRYNCVEWIQYDGSIFNPPTAVLFRDAAEINAEYGTIYEEGEF